MNSKPCAIVSKLSEHKKQTNAIHFECKKRNVSQELNYFKKTYPSKMNALQALKNLGYNWYFISMVGSSG